MSIRSTGSGTLQVQALSPESWEEQRRDFLENSSELSLDSHGDFDVQILSPLISESKSTGTLRAVIIERDDERIGKHKLVNSSRKLITEALLLWDRLEPALLTVLNDVISGKGLVEDSIGEFFLFYGKFEEKYQVSNGKEAKVKMFELLGDNDIDLKEYSERGKSKSYPLPYVVRNILSHKGRNPNALDAEGKDLIRSIQLLKKWTK